MPGLLTILFPLSAIILLSFVLAISFLLVILSCALWSNWLPLIVGECRHARCHCLTLCLDFE